MQTLLEGTVIWDMTAYSLVEFTDISEKLTATVVREEE
jgi:hypothetical protein